MLDSDHCHAPVQKTASRTLDKIMPETRLSRKLAPRPVNKDLFEQLEKSLLTELSRLFLVPRDGIEIRFTVKSQDVSERSDSVAHYRPQNLPEHVDSAMLLLHYKPESLVALVEVSPRRQGQIVLHCDDDSVSTRLIGLSHFVERILGGYNRARALPQPNTLHLLRRIPSCKLTVDQLKALPRSLDRIMAGFFGKPIEHDQKDIEISARTSEGSMEAECFDQLPPLSEIRSLEINIRHAEKDRSSSITIELAPASRKNTLELRLTAFDPPAPLNSADSIARGILQKLAEHRTLHGIIYWPEPVGILVWTALLFLVMALLNHGASVVVLILVLLLPLCWVVAQRQYLYVSFEPRSRSVFDQALTALVTLAVTVLLLPWFISWIAGLLR